jgi:hypothetical protein
LILPLALLAGCNGNKTDRNDQRSASGEVLQGTTSDAMLPLDKLKSQGPMLAPSERKSTPEGVDDEGSGVDEATSETSAAPEDGATASPSPSPSSSPARGGGSPQG